MADLAAATGIRSFTDVKSLLTKTYSEWSEDNASRLGAALAYYTTLSLAPLLILLIALIGLVFGKEAAQGQLMGQIQGLVGAEGAEAIQTMVQNASKPSSGIIASIIGFLTLIFGASSVAGELKNALNVIWDRDNNDASITDMVKARSTALLVVLACGFLLVVSLAVSSAIAAAGSILTNLLPLPEAVLQVLNILLSLLVMTGVFAVMFKYLPDVELQWRDVFLGAAFTALLFTIGKFLIGLYLGKASIGSTYGAAGSLVVVLVWVYYSSQIFFFGAEFTQVYSCAHGSDPQRKRSPAGAPKVAPVLPVGVVQGAKKGALHATNPYLAQVASGNAGLSAAPPEERKRGWVGTLIGSALAVTRVRRLFGK